MFTINQVSLNVTKLCLYFQKIKQTHLYLGLLFIAYFKMVYNMLVPIRIAATIIAQPK